MKEYTKELISRVKNKKLTDLFINDSVNVRSTNIYTFTNVIYIDKDSRILFLRWFTCLPRNNILIVGLVFDFLKHMWTGPHMLINSRKTKFTFTHSLWSCSNYWKI